MFLKNHAYKYIFITKDRRQKNPNQGNQKQDASRKDEKQACIPSKDMPCRKNKNPNCYTDCDGSEVLSFKLHLKNYISKYLVQGI